MRTYRVKVRLLTKSRKKQTLQKKAESYQSDFYYKELLRIQYESLIYNCTKRTQIPLPYEV